MVKGKPQYAASVEEWVDSEHLILIQGWARDGLTYKDIANQIGISVQTLVSWRKQYPELDEAMRQGRDVVDYMVENSLLKSALGYKTKEVKVTTIMRHGVVVETQREVLKKEVAPSVHAAKVWLYNRRPEKWRNMDRSNNLLEEIGEDTSIQITVTRAGEEPNDTEVEESQGGTGINQQVSLRKATPEEQQQKRAEQEARVKAEQHVREHALDTTVDDSDEQVSADLDYWPDDWQDDE